MADRARCDLPYGHFGRADFSLDDHRWYFERDLAFSSTTQQLGEPMILSKSSHPSPGIDIGLGHGPSSKRHPKQIKAAADSTPDLRPASDIILPLLRVSEAAREAVRRHDPLRGSLVAFGDIQSHSRNRPIQVAAYAMGQTGCEICIAQVQKQKRGWDDDRRCWLEVPTLRGERATWSSHGGPIQQVHFASNVQPGPALLAVRSLAGTAIVRAVQEKSPSEEALGSSISSNTLYNVQFTQTGGYPHADVAFNPWFSQQVALVDVVGNWTVLEFSARNMSQIACTWSSLAGKIADETGSCISDGWARTAWVADLGTLAVCTRNSLRLFSIAADDPTLIEKMELGLSGIVPWVLDFLILPRHRDHMCVLTTTHVMVYKVTETASSQKTVKMRFRIRHYKSPEDLSLRLTTWVEGKDEDANVLIYSSALGVVSSYRFTLSEAQPAMTTDCMEIPLPTTSANATKSGSIVSVGIQRVDIGYKPTVRSSDYHPKGARFFTALIAQEGIGVCQTLFCVGADAVIPPLTWEAKLPTSSFKLSRPQFVIEDSLLDHDDIATRRIEPSARRSRQANSQPAQGNRTIGLEQVADLLQSPVGDTESFAHVLATVQSELVQSDLDTVVPMRTLHSIAQAELDVGDVEHCSAAFERLLNFQNNRMEGSPGPSSGVVENTHRLTLAPLEIPPSLGLEDLRLNSGLSSVNDRALALWVTPLPDNIPGRIRLAKAKLCGLVSAQLVLASQSLCIEEVPESQPTQEETQTQTKSQDAYSQSSQTTTNRFGGGNRGFDLSQLDSSQPFQSSALPTPSQTPSVTTASTRPSTFAAPELHRLSKYTAFSKPAPPVLPRSLNNVLSHWTVGEDVNNYDWMSTSRRIAQHDDDEDDDLTETERKRAQRRAERHLRRQRKEAAASQARQIASSQAPEIFSASQPSAARVESQPSGIAASSQFTGFGVGAAVGSQVEAGRFGGRPPVAAGKKRRRQGF